MLRKIFVASAVVLSLVILSGCKGGKTGSAENEPMRIIMDTDIGNDIDDALAMDMLYKYMDAGRINLLGVNINRESEYPPQYIDILNTWYGYPEIPIGIVHNGADCSEVPTDYPMTVDTMTVDGKPAFKRTLSGYGNLPEAHVLYRKLLAGQPDSSVTIVSVGFSTNLARLLDTPADEYSPLTGKELVARKVRLLCTMAGKFDVPDAFEFNIMKDVPAARKVFSEWPGPIVTSPFEVGCKVLYPASAIENDFPEMSPVAEAYKVYMEMPYNRETWDLTAVLYAVEHDSAHFGISAKGKVVVSDAGGTTFVEDPEGNCQYLTINPSQAQTVLERILELTLAVPESLKK